MSSQNFRFTVACKKFTRHADQFLEKEELSVSKVAESFNRFISETREISIVQNDENLLKKLFDNAFVYIICVSKFAESESILKWSSVRSFYAEISRAFDTRFWKNNFVKHLSVRIIQLMSDPAMQPWISKEILHMYLGVVIHTDREIRYTLMRNEGAFHLISMIDLLSCGDYEFQSMIVEFYCRMCTKKMLLELKPNIYLGNEEQTEAFFNIKTKQFDRDTRKFLNLYNFKGNTVRSLLCCKICFNGYKMRSPQELQDFGGMWVDFNLKMRTITFFFDHEQFKDEPDNKEQWECAMILFDNISNRDIVYKINEKRTAEVGVCKLTLKGPCNFLWKTTKLTACRNLTLYSYDLKTFKEIFNLPELKEKIKPKNKVPVMSRRSSHEYSQLDIITIKSGSSTATLNLSFGNSILGLRSGSRSSKTSRYLDSDRSDDVSIRKYLNVSSTSNKSDRSIAYDTPRLSLSLETTPPFETTSGNVAPTSSIVIEADSTSPTTLKNNRLEHVDDEALKFNEQDDYIARFERKKRAEKNRSKRVVDEREQERTGFEEETERVVTFSSSFRGNICKGIRNAGGASKREAGSSLKDDTSRQVWDDLYGQDDYLTLNEKKRRGKASDNDRSKHAAEKKSNESVLVEKSKKTEKDSKKMENVAENQSVLAENASPKSKKTENVATAQKTVNASKQVQNEGESCEKKHVMFGQRKNEGESVFSEKENDLSFCQSPKRKTFEENFNTTKKKKKKEDVFYSSGSKTLDLLIRGRAVVGLLGTRRKDSAPLFSDGYDDDHERARGGDTNDSEFDRLRLTTINRENDPSSSRSPVGPKRKMFEENFNTTKKKKNDVFYSSGSTTLDLLSRGRHVVSLLDAQQKNSAPLFSDDYDDDHERARGGDTTDSEFDRLRLTTNFVDVEDKMAAGVEEAFVDDEPGPVALETAEGKLTSTATEQFETASVDVYFPIHAGVAMPENPLSPIEEEECDDVGSLIAKKDEDGRKNESEDVAKMNDRVKILRNVKLKASYERPSRDDVRRRLDNLPIIIEDTVGLNIEEKIEEIIEPTKKKDNATQRHEPSLLPQRSETIEETAKRNNNKDARDYFRKIERTKETVDDFDRIRTLNLKSTLEENKNDDLAQIKTIKEPSARRNKEENKRRYYDLDRIETIEEYEARTKEENGVNDKKQRHQHVETCVDQINLRDEEVSKTGERKSTTKSLADEEKQNVKATNKKKKINKVKRLNDKKPSSRSGAGVGKGAPPKRRNVRNRFVEEKDEEDESMRRRDRKEEALKEMFEEMLETCRKNDAAKKKHNEGGNSSSDDDSTVSNRQGKTIRKESDAKENEEDRSRRYKLNFPTTAEVRREGRRKEVESDRVVRGLLKTFGKMARLVNEDRFKPSSKTKKVFAKCVPWLEKL